MAKSLLMLLSVIAEMAMFGQNAYTLKAGDPAPEIDWNKIVQSPASAKYRPNLAGQYTVLQFLPIRVNLQAIARWNDLSLKFQDKPVQFVWVGSEPWPEVEPFIKEHPIDGWLLIDEKREIAAAYGVLGQVVIIDPSGRIAGFTWFLDAHQLSAILDGNAVAISQDTGDDQVMKLLAGGRIRLEDEPDRLPDPAAVPVKPDVPPSYEVHISPSSTKGTNSSAGPDYWVQRGFDLKSIAAMVYEKEPARVEIPKSLDNGDRFDFVLVLPKHENDKTIHELARQAIEKYFNVAAVAEQRPSDVYVMTAIKGKTPPEKTGPDSLGGGFGSSSGFQVSLPPGTPETPEAMKKAIEELMKHPENVGIANISAGNATMDEFRQDLERGLDRPVVDETGMRGVYDVVVSGDAKNREEFIRMLRDQTGLVLTPATRNVEFLVLQPLN